MKEKFRVGDRLVVEFRDKRLFYSKMRSVSYIGGYPFYDEVKSGTLWLIEVTGYDIHNAILAVKIIDRNFQGAMPPFQEGIIDPVEEILFPGNQNKSARFHNTAVTQGHQASNESVPQKEDPTNQVGWNKPKNDIRRFPFEVKADIESLLFQNSQVSFSVNDCNGYGKVELKIIDQRIQEAFGHIRPYLLKAIKTKSITIKAEIEARADLTCTCLNAISPELESFLSDGLDKIRIDILAGQFFEGSDEEIGFQSIDALTAIVEALGGQTLDVKALLNDLGKKKPAKHALELNYLAENHLDNRMKVHFLKEAMSFLFLVEGKTRFHLVLEVYDKKLATYIWHCVKDQKSLDAKINEVRDNAAMLSSGNRQPYKSSRKRNEFKAINHRYDSNALHNFQDWKREFELACD